MKTSREHRHEAVELCPYCEGEHLEPDWVPSSGYRAKCVHFGKYFRDRSVANGEYR